MDDLFKIVKKQKAGEIPEAQKLDVSEAYEQRYHKIKSHIFIMNPCYFHPANKSKEQKRQVYEVAAAAYANYDANGEEYWDHDSTSK